MTGSRCRDAQQAQDLRTFVDAAQRLGCPLVKIFDTQVRPGQSRASAAVAAAASRSGGGTSRLVGRRAPSHRIASRPVSAA